MSKTKPGKTTLIDLHADDPRTVARRLRLRKAQSYDEKAVAHLRNEEVAEFFDAMEYVCGDGNIESAYRAILYEWLARRNLDDLMLAITGVFPSDRVQASLDDCT